MTDVVKKQIVYVGITQPSTLEEISVEICGLKNSIKQAEELISRLELAQTIALMKKKEMIDEQVSSTSVKSDSSSEKKEEPREED
jgi:hypothetical protein